MAAYQHILTAREGDVLAITLNRPERLNALVPAMLDEIRAAVEAAPGEGARAILVTGAGRAFCAGADLQARGDGALKEPGENLRAHYNPMALAFANSAVPIVTAINGPAAGAGASIALAGDIVIAARSSYLMLAFAGIGLVPDAGATWLVAKGAGRARALEMALLGEKLDAADAEDAGLVTRTVDDAALQSVALDYATRLAAMPTVALGLIRKQVGAALQGTFEATLEIEAEHQSAAGRTADFAEGVAAFVAKRKPVFRGA